MSDDLREPRTFSELKALLDENKRLKAALRKIADNSVWPWTDIARAALEGK